MPQRELEKSHGRNVPIGDLNVVHSGWVLKKKRKKMQGKLKRSGGAVVGGHG